MIFLYNVILLFFGLLLLSALIFKVALAVLVDSGTFSFSSLSENSGFFPLFSLFL